MFRYESSWRDYTFPVDGPHAATAEELRKLFTEIDMSRPRVSATGPIVYADGDRLIVNNETEHTICYGETGSKKTRSFVAPLLCQLAKAGESAIITDIKGELSTHPVVRRIMKEYGVEPVFIDFQNFAGDGYNIFEYAAKLYCADNRDRAMANIMRITSMLLSKYNGTKADPYWADMAPRLITPCIEILLELAAQRPEYMRYVNMLSVSEFVSEKGCCSLERLCENYYGSSIIPEISMLQSVFSVPDRTKSCIISTVESMITDFILLKKMLSMLSFSTFRLEDIYDKPTFVFVIVPDETSAFDNIAGLLIDNMYSQLVESFGERFQNREAPNCRINFVCDEFCNVKINNMRAKISAARSREIRFFLICQSLRQLYSSYPDDAATIQGNCKNVLFLQSSDPELLESISQLSGKTKISTREGGEPLVSVETLRSLKKTWESKEAIFIRDDTVCKVTLPDIDEYSFAKGLRKLGNVAIPCKIPSRICGYSPARLLSDLSLHRVNVPFCGIEAA